METMKNEAPKNEKKQQSPAKPVHPLVAELAAAEGVPVAELRFCVQNGRDLPLAESNGGISNLKAKADTDITFLPKLLLYRVVRRHRDPDVKTKTFYIPREWAMFEPLE